MWAVKSADWVHFESLNVYINKLKGSEAMINLKSDGKGLMVIKTICKLLKVA